MRPDGRVDIARVGFSGPGLFRDLYHLSIRLSWPRFLACLLLGWVLVNVVFAVGYYAGGLAWIEGSDGSFSAAFFFSVQTLSTIGYGAMSPATMGANLLVTVEALVGMLMTAVATGLIFARFSTPTARVMFSEQLLVTTFDGRRVLMLRLANARQSYLVEARLTVTMLRDEVTLEGERIRRFLDLPLVRHVSPVLALGWTVFHEVDESSPLAGCSAQELRDKNVGFLVSLQAVDERLEQGVHARRAYDYRDVVFDMRFSDMLRTLPDGTRIVDYSHFDRLEPLELHPPTGHEAEPDLRRSAE